MPSVFSRLQFARCTGAVPGQVFTAPGPVIAVAYNGIFLRSNVQYSQAGGIITLQFSTEQGDRIDALCIA